ncbi:IPT/TIG domain-containing protein [Leifsonia xyli]|uniref:IPT/TIG domain-containing protein n=1 Tax=Leifsonia xyli TaxID=1575 RepID=UPI0009DB6F6B
MRSVVAASVAVLLSAGAILGAAAPSVAAPTESGANPTVSGLSKTVGDVMGGEHIAITGRHLQNATEVCFGQGCVPVTSATPKKVTVTTPPHYGYQGGQAQAVVPDYQKGTVTVTFKRGQRETVIALQRYRYEALTPPDGKCPLCSRTGRSTTAPATATSARWAGTA